MAKLLPDPIDAGHLRTFVSKDSDFGFEMRCAHKFAELGFSVQHGRTYRDPITGKHRAFDLRCRIGDDRLKLSLAVECKNIRESYPILVSALPRAADEAFMDVILRGEEHRKLRTTVGRDKDKKSVYTIGGMVGRSVVQVGRDSNGFVSSNEETYDRLSQATNSCRDLVEELAKPSRTFRAAVVPVLAIPNQKLWQAEYKADGSLDVEPRRVERASVFLGASWEVDFVDGFGARKLTYHLSHLEIVTEGALEDFVSALSKSLRK